MVGAAGGMGKNMVFFHNVKWDQQVASLRYVDDLIQISSFFCVWIVFKCSS